MILILNDDVQFVNDLLSMCKMQETLYEAVTEQQFRFQVVPQTTELPEMKYSQTAA